MNKFKPKKNRKVLFDVLLIALFNVLFWVFFRDKNLLEMIKEYQLDHIILFVFPILFSLLYYATRRWFECAKLMFFAERHDSKDMLTKLYNRRALEGKLLLEWQRYSRYNESFALVMIHIDDLKVINDNFGHQEGDRIIIEVSEKLRHNTRKTDFCARWSGTEFLILCPISELSPILALAERLRADVYRLLKDGVELTISLSVAQVDQHKSLGALFKKVEFQLYKAKKTGGNCVVSE